jgi:hypothetical protein
LHQRNSLAQHVGQTVASRVGDTVDWPDVALWLWKRQLAGRSYDPIDAKSFGGEMNKITALVAAWGLALAMPAFGQAQKAADTSANSQQNKMKVCNDKAGDMKGEERKAFMKTCLSSTPAKMTQSEKMSMCNKKTAGLKGEERNKAQSECMKSS